MSLWHRLDFIARNLSPFAITLFLVVLSVVPTHIPGFGTIVPALSLMAVYYWSIFRPDLIPAWTVFLVGLFQDILVSTPLGLHALILLLVRATVVSRRRFFMGNSFFIMWGGFMLVAAGALAIGWEVLSLLNLTMINPSSLAFQYFLTVGLFPCFTWLFIRVQQAFLPQA
ncbi:MAG: rod shape-determining protein MreD [Rhodospirillaceae bacterium]|nr:rod shape-determining protein MreD [Rhodospirillaceae bacterium]MBT5374385.1 rod shape-determining protein MreD [Rhodospirillaceae bacterium]MBT5752681.1 rod shape-determining protein MreD [Rhodospirillaceae bacterium]